MEIEIEKDLHSYKQRVYKDFFYWLGSTWYIVAIVFTIYGIIHTLDIRALYFIVAYLVMGFIGRANYQRLNMKRIYIHDNKVTLEFKKYNKDKVYNFNLKDCKFMENPWDKFQRQSILMKSNSFKYVQQNDYYWRSSDIDLILDSFIEYKERSVNFRKFIDYS